ncbi:MmyB family transcriptional regulator [Paractinoplanes durhamensis]|uniref:MmyB family transcriptional regulator n=1 Tax=Paractinoplanes durhamensis TaxID=113563 RepID=UPI0023B24ABD|nr:transcriptional regulator [Actinoplanes durhamensis]
MLQLDDEHLAYLLALVADAPRKRRRRPRKEVVPPGALKLLGSLVQPAFIEGRYFDILAANSLARALSPGLAEGGNQLRDLFLDPAEQAYYPDWEAITECYIASLRQAVGTDVHDPRLIELTGELSLASAQFRRLWARHEVRKQTGTLIRFQHPQVGELVLNRERMSIGGADGLMLVVYHPDAGSSNAEKLALLASVDLPVTRDTQQATR